MDYISTTFNNTMPHAQRLGAQLRPQQVHPVILLPQKFPASKTCKWNAPNMQNNERLQDFCLTALFKIYSRLYTSRKMDETRLRKNYEESTKYIKIHAITQIQKQMSSGKLTAAAGALFSSTGTDTCSWARMNGHACLKSYPSFSETISTYLKLSQKLCNATASFSAVWIGLVCANGKEKMEDTTPT